MTHDRKDDSKAGKEIEKSRKKTDSSAPVSSSKTVSPAEGLPTKVRSGLLQFRTTQCTQSILERVNVKFKGVAVFLTKML